eukprot:gb/GECG01002935.1/.p1 GENE.gb/GECG01002935.1/~~gb/GECG01002935.1/.p1  ORF type:complete len:106 (+),score=1.60 gb/GECG01002935.1/:1-318(+)
MATPCATCLLKYLYIADSVSCVDQQEGLSLRFPTHLLCEWPSRIMTGILGSPSVRETSHTLYQSVVVIAKFANSARDTNKTGIFTTASHSTAWTVSIPVNILEFS